MFSNNTRNRTAGSLDKVYRNRKRLTFCFFGLVAVLALALTNLSVVVKSSGPLNSVAPPVSENLMDNVPTIYASANSGAQVLPARALLTNAMIPLPAPMPASVSDSITLSDPTFVRPSAAGVAGTPTTCPASGNPSVHYKLYEFNLAGCGVSSPVTISTCGAGVDTTIYVYRKGDGSASSAASPTFMPGSACTNVVVSNNNNVAACGTTGPSSVTTNLPSGNIIVVVGTNFANQTGPFTLSVTSPTCVVTQVPTCNATIDHTSQSFAAAGGSDNVNVTIGSSCPWTASTSDSFIHITAGASGLGDGTVSYTVDANSGSARTGTISIAGLTFNVTQEAGTVALPCIEDALVSPGPSYVRPSIASGGGVSCPASGNPTVKYKAYEFDLTGCASGLVTASTCTNGACPGTVTLADTILTIYRKSDGSASTPGSPIFNPATPCSNAVVGNNNSAACGAGSQLSSVTQSLPAGHFVVVVAAANAGDEGTFHLNVSTAGSGCVVNLAPVCSNVNGTVTPATQTMCPGGSANISVSVSGGTAPYSVSLNNGGGTMSGPGPFTFTVSPAATTTYTASGTDANGCPITMSGTATVTVSDTTPPTITCPADSSASADASCMAAVPDYASAATASDNCSGTVTKTQSPAAGTMVGLGPHTVTVTATDANGNSSNCTVTFTVNDTTAPTVSCPSGTSASADASCMAAVPDYASAATASDNCGPITKTQSPAAGTMVGIGPHTVTVTATDGAGNSSSCTTTFTVNDTTAPTVSCPSGTSASADASCMAAVPDYASAATASDNCGPITKTQSPAAGSMVGLGPHTVTVTATDGAGNSSSCTTTFTVNDTTAPTVSCPSGTSASADASCMAAVPDYASAATASDNCGPVTKTQSPAAGSMVGLGPHTVTVTATDGAGNTNSCTTTFTVNDTSPPAITCPSGTSASADASCMAAVPDYTAGANASDNCGPVTKTQSPAAGTMVGLGPHTVTVTATDGSGNTNSCTTTFTVNDTTAPTVSCPSGTSASADASCMAAVPDYTAGASASDNCGPVTKSQSPAAGTMVGLGPHTVTVTATDGAGNSSSCTTTFTVNDTTPPVVACPPPSTATADPSTCKASIPNVASSATATDNCSSSGNISKSQSPAAGTQVGPGTYTITVTATDQAGNSSTCTTTFTVIDATGPVITLNGQTPSLWPPNHAYHTFTAASFVASVSDSCSGAINLSSVYIIKVTSDEVENGSGDGNTLNDIVIASDCKSVQLRAEREGSADGRVYHITLGVQDSSGNTTTAVATVVVPKSQNGASAIDSGTHYTVNSSCP